MGISSARLPLDAAVGRPGAAGQQPPGAAVAVRALPPVAAVPAGQRQRAVARDVAAAEPPPAAAVATVRALRQPSDGAELVAWAQASQPAVAVPRPAEAPA